MMVVMRAKGNTRETSKSILSQYEINSVFGDVWYVYQ